jgi:microcystin-dependent protein
MMKFRNFFSGLMFVAAAILASYVVINRPVSAQLGATQTYLGTAGGTTNALTLTIHSVASFNDMLGVPFRFVASGTNTTAVTITVNLDSGGTLGPVALFRQVPASGGQIAMAGGELQSNQITEIVGQTNSFALISPTDTTPVGTAIDIRGTLAPAGYLIEDGTCYSRTAYAALFTAIGATYNGGAPLTCSGSQFAVPDSRGMAFVATDNQGSQGSAGRITTTTCPGPNNIGQGCGLEKQTLGTSNLPPYTPAGTLTGLGANNGTNGAPLSIFQGGGTNGFTTGAANASGPLFGAGGITLSGTFAGTPQGGTSVPVPTLPPIRLGLRAIKY